MSGNISININLRQLKSVVESRKMADGTMGDCLVIPIKANHLVVGEKNKGVHLDLAAHASTNPKPDRKDTHLVKQNLPKDVYGKLNEEERKSMPILGNAILWGSREAEPQEASIEKPEEEQDDLPF